MGEKEMLQLLLQKMTGLETEIAGIKTGMTGLEAKIEGVRTSLEARIEGVKEELTTMMDTKLAESEARMDTKLAKLEARMDTKLTELEARMDTKLAESEARMTAKMDAKTDEMKRYFDIVIEDKVSKEIRVIAEQYGGVIDRQKKLERVDEKADDLKDRVQVLEVVVAKHSGEIQALQRA